MGAAVRVFRTGGELGHTLTGIRLPRSARTSVAALLQGWCSLWKEHHEDSELRNDLNTVCGPRLDGVIPIDGQDEELRIRTYHEVNALGL